MNSSIEGETLAQRYSFLPADAEDISYRMYDLFVRQYPKLKTLFNGSREFHIRLFICLIESPASFTDNKTSIRPHSYNDLKAITTHAYLIKYPNLLILNRRSFISAITDVLFDEAHPQLVRECKGIYDAVSSKVRKNAA